MVIATSLCNAVSTTSCDNGMHISDCTLCMYTLFCCLIHFKLCTHKIAPSQHVRSSMLCFMWPASHDATSYNMPFAALCNRNQTFPHTFMTAQDDHDRDTSLFCNKSFTAHYLFVIPHSVSLLSFVSHPNCSCHVNSSRLTTQQFGDLRYCFLAMFINTYCQ